MVENSDGGENCSKRGTAAQGLKEEASRPLKREKKSDHKVRPKGKENVS